MKKELKAVCGLFLAVAAVISAGRAGAEISIGMEPAVYSVRPAAWGQVSMPSSTDRLSAAAEKLAEAAGSGDNAKVETLLAGLYSGAAGKEAAAPVYASNKQTVPAPVVPAPVKRIAPARAKRAAATRAASARTTEAEWVLIAQEADATEEAPAVKEKDGKDEAAKPEAEGVSNIEQAAADYDNDFGAVATAEEKPEETLLQTLLGGSIGMLLVVLLLLL